MARDELRTTFEYQVQRLQEIDTKAIEIRKANLLLIGIVVTGGSILVQTDLEIAPFVNGFTIFGCLLLLVSTGLAAVTYTASNLRGGLDGDAIEATIAARTPGSRDDVHFRERLLRSYGEWIEYNARVTAVNDVLATVTALLVFVAFVYVVAGVVVGTARVAPVVEVGGFLVMTAAVGWLTWLADHMDHFGHADPPRGDAFEGVRLSKGASRALGFDGLRSMLGRRSPGDEE